VLALAEPRVKRRALLASAGALAACSMLPGAAGDPRARARSLLAGMTLEDTVGQLMSVAFHGSEIPASLEQVIRAQRVGSVIIFAENVASPARLAALLADLQRIARQAQLPPLLLLIDQEGGPIVRLGKGATVLPAPMALAATPDPAAAIARAASITAQECRALGLNFVLAPVADVQSNPANPVILARSFGSDPRRVADAAAGMVRAYASAGLLCCAKHFPGHGDTSVDSHTTLPELAHDLTRLERVELVPFRAAIAAGVPAIMTAHLRLPALEPAANVPATLSPALVGGLLRQRLGFGGLVLSDDLEMRAITDVFPTSDAAALAVAAGCDMLLFRFDVEAQRRAHASLAERVRSGALPRGRLEEAALRVLAAKARYGVLDAQAVDPAGAGARVGTDANRDGALALARAAVTVLRNRGVLPLRGKRVLVLSPEPGELRNDEALIDDQRPFGAHLGALLPVTARPLQLRPSAADIAAHGRAAAEHDVVVLATADAAKYPQQAALVSELAAARPVAVVSLRSPYDVMAFPTVPAYVCAYDTRDAACHATAEVLVGARAPTGRLPVEIPGLFALGAGLASL
jgi:beta-N-acetylhexosaminidase